MTAYTLAHVGILLYRLNTDGSGESRLPAKELADALYPGILWWMSVVLLELNMRGIINSRDEEKAQTFLRIAWDDEGKAIPDGVQMDLSRGEWQKML